MIIFSWFRYLIRKYLFCGSMLTGKEISEAKAIQVTTASLLFCR
jgi:hypothetical protein